jgi:hypothetical protein
MWSIDIQQKITPNLIVEASYVGTRAYGPWVNPKAISLQRLAQFGLDTKTPKL